MNQQGNVKTYCGGSISANTGDILKDYVDQIAELISQSTQFWQEFE